MKTKFLKIILILSSAITIVIALEFMLFNYEKYKYEQSVKISGGFFKKAQINYYRKPQLLDLNNPLWKRPTESYGNKYNILVFGCSFAYGSNLKNDEILSYMLAKQTQSTVYNKAFPGCGVQYMLYQIKQENFLSEINKPDYVIYIFMDDHINRLNYYYWGNISENCSNLRYKYKNNKLIEHYKIGNIFSCLYTTKYILKIKEKSLNSHKNYQKNNDLFLEILKESRHIIHQKFEDAKFVVIFYDPCTLRGHISTIDLQNKLIQNNFMVLHTDDFVPDDLTKPQYHFGKDSHPTKEAWELITPALIKELNL